MPRALTLIIALILAFFPGTRARAGGMKVPASATYAFRAYGPSQGLSSLSVWSIVQDQQGFIWVATEFGVFRYDGNRFKGLTMHDGLPSLYIDHLHLTADGTLWAGSDAGLAFLREGRFVTVQGPVGSAAILALDSSRGAGLWAGTAQGPFWAVGGGNFLPVAGWPGGAATAICASPEGASMWVAARNAQGTRLLHWTPAGFQEVPVRGGLGGERLDGLVVDGHGWVWARSLTRLWHLAPGEQAFSLQEPALPATTQVALLKVDRRGHLLVGTSQGIYWHLDEGWVRIGPREGLPRVTLRDLMEDREGSLWIASIGLYRLMGGGMWRAYTTAQGLPSDIIWSFARMDDGDLLVGTDLGPARSTPEGWRTIRGLEGHQVRSIIRGPEGTWLMTGGPVIFQWTPGTGRIATFGQKEGVPSTPRIFRLLLDPDGILWAATQGSGLLRGERSGRGWRFSRVALPEEKPYEWIRDLCLDRAGRLWATGDYGLAVLEKGSWRRLGPKEGLRVARVAYIRQRADGEMVLAYVDALGLSRFRYVDGRLDHLVHVDAAQGLPTQKIFQIGEDSLGNIWVGTGLGIDVIGPDGFVEHFGFDDGLVSEDTNAQAFLAGPDGRVWVGTSSGVACYDPGAHPKQSAPPAPVILGLVFGDRAETGTNLQIPFSRNSFEASFGSLTYLREQVLQHQTRLVGLDDKWREQEGRTQLFPGLRPGAYTFEVRARVGMGAWGPATRVPFTILPAWWQTFWFRIVAGLALAMAVALAVGWEVLHLRARNLHLEGLVKARTTALEEAMENLRNLSFTDPLTGLRNRRFLSSSISTDVSLVLRAYAGIAQGRDPRPDLNVDIIFLMLDLDHFKEVNDHHGHAAGDAVLQQIKGILEACTRESDMVVRWGGEEFLVVGRNCCRAEAGVLAERIRSSVASHPFLIEGGQVLSLTCSGGFAIFPLLRDNPNRYDWEKVVALADLGLYAAKRSGRNAWVGIMAGEETLEGDLEGELASLVPALVASGHLQLFSSLAEGVKVRWE